jgi:hypothetical protein
MRRLHWSAEEDWLFSTMGTTIVTKDDDVSYKYHLAHTR